MTFLVRVTEAAFEDLAEIGHWILSEGAPEAAERWIAEVLQSLGSLAEMPSRCPLAPENAEFDRGIRHLLLGDYRALYVVQDEEVVVLHVRHGRRQVATLYELAAALAELRRSTDPDPDES